jgi:1-acyl-sn-glycerol-3-phosphate acyltransferase
LVTGAPVVPIAQWGPQDVLAPYGKRFRLLPRKTMHLKAGPPVDLSEFADYPMDAETLRLVTEKIMTAITVLLEDLRGEHAPAVRFDPRAAGVPPTGDPRRINPGKRSA